MSICYSKERKAWDLREITEDEQEQIVGMGIAFLMQRLGISMVEEEARQDAERDFLEKVPNDKIAQA